MEGEELETVQSIFSEEVSVCEGDEGSKLVEYRSKGDLVLTVQLTGMCNKRGSAVPCSQWNRS